MSDEIRISAPDRTERPAGFIKCLAALIYDYFLLAGILFVTTAVMLVFRGGQAFPPYNGWYSASLLGVSALFFCWFWTHGGQTPGMRAWRIQLIRADGTAPGWQDALWRCGWALLGASVAGLGYLWMVGDSKKRSWQDIGSSTRIVDFRQ